MPLSDSSGTFSCEPCGLSLHPPSCCWLAAGVSEASRFSCMKLPRVPGVSDYAGPGRHSRYRPRPFCLPPSLKFRRPDCIFSELNTQPTCTPVYASPYTSRCATQTSGPSGSLLLSRRSLLFPASCRFIPAHSNRDFASSDHAKASPEISTFGYVKLSLSARSKRLLDTVALISLLKHRKCSDTRSFCPKRLAKKLDASR
jgi:hypothetical protein